MMAYLRGALRNRGKCALPGGTNGRRFRWNASAKDATKCGDLSLAAATRSAA